MKVMIAEDELVSRRLLQSNLERWGHEVTAVRNGQEAWTLFQAGDFPVVVSDWIMPEMDGLELIRRIRACPRSGYVYAILVTSKSQTEDIIEGMEAGADDFISKPFDRDELRVRLRAGQRVIELERALVNSLDDLGRARQRENETGARIQQMLLLGQLPHEPRSLRVAALTIPSEHIDGDFYDFVEHDGKRLDVIVGDVMGKGVPAALLGAAIKSHFLRALSHLAAGLDRGNLPEPEDIVAAVHAEVTKQFIGLEIFATLCYARFDLARGRVDFVDCGHTKTIHLRRRVGTSVMLQGDNVPLGFSERESYRQMSVPLDQGDMFFFYSDGVTEARNEAGEFFGADRLVKLIETNGQLEPEELIDTVRQAVVAFSRSETFTDDLTCVAVKLADTASEEPIAHSELEVLSDLTELERIRNFVRSFCCDRLSPAISEERVSQLELAVTEVASNIMRHAYRAQSDQLVQISADAFADRVWLRLSHTGETFDPKAVCPPAFDGSREGGFGVYIVAHSVDEVRHGRDDRGRNCVSLMKYRGTPPEGSTGGAA